MLLCSKQSVLLCSKDSDASYMLRVPSKVLKCAFLIVMLAICGPASMFASWHGILFRATNYQHLYDSSMGTWGAHLVVIT